MAKIEKKKDDRARNWAFVAYPESMPENWREVLESQQLTWACSPEHNKDVNETASGGPELKKAHRHFILKFDGKKSYEQVLEITDLLNAPHPQVCKNLVGAVRYFIHRDNPEKAQYSELDILEGGGFDTASYLAMSPAQERVILQEIFKWCRENGVSELCELSDYIIDEKGEWWPVFVAYNAVIYRTLRSRKCRDQELRSLG